MAFPDKLKVLRLRHKLTQDELGEKLCLSRKVYLTMSKENLSLILKL